MKQAVRSSILHFTSDPAEDGDDAYLYFDDGMLIFEDGRILEIGEADVLIEANSEIPVTHYPDKLILPGLIDPHIHYPQTEVIASYGEQLLTWLNKYTFPTERKFSAPDYASKMADFFLDELLRNGTTSAAVFGTVHKASVDAFFEASDQRNMRMICGKVMMDRHAPPDLCQNAAQCAKDSQDLINKWHGHGRQLYAITPRFAITSSDEQLRAAGELYQQNPGTYLQTHLAENTEEVDTIRQLFPKCRDYLDVYDRFDLLGENSLFAHGIHLNERELYRLCNTQSRIIFCPSSNLFLGSGLLDTAALDAYKVNWGIATDVGAGTSFSLLHTLLDAYKISQLNDAPISPLRGLYMATLGNARAFGLQDEIGTLMPGSAADFVVIDLNCTPLMSLKTSHCRNLSDQLFALIVLGDDRAVAATYIAGEKRYSRDQSD